MGHQQVKNWQQLFNGRDEELQMLINCWQRAKTGEPQIAVVLGETGLGKTRLIQEFYSYLSKRDTDDDPGYWPELLKIGRNLELSVDVNQLNLDVDIPWLWWPIRFTEDSEQNSSNCRSPFEDIPEELGMHAISYKRMLERNGVSKKTAKEIGSLLEGAMGVASATVTGLANINTYGLFGISMSLYQLYKAQLKYRAKNPTAGLSEILLERTREAVERTLTCLRMFMDKNSKATECPKVPVIIILDDSQWADPVSLFSLWFIFNEARDKNWPLMLICSHWEKEWNESDEISGDLRQSLVKHANNVKEAFKLFPNTYSLKQIYTFFETLDSRSTQLIALGKLVPDLLESKVEMALPNIQKEDIQMLVSEADGNPRAMEEMILMLTDNAMYYFVDRTVNSSLNESGKEALAKLMHTDLYAKIAQRYRRMSLPLRTFLSTGALFGRDFIRPMTVDLINSNKLEILPADADILAEQAQNTHALINHHDINTDSFLQNLYQKVAYNELKQGNEEKFLLKQRAIADVFKQWLYSDKYQLLSQLEKEELLASILQYACAQVEPGAIEAEDIAHAFDTLLFYLHTKQQRARIVFWWSIILKHQHRTWYSNFLLKLNWAPHHLMCAVDVSSQLIECVEQVIELIETKLAAEDCSMSVRQQCVWHWVIGDIQYYHFADKRHYEKAISHFRLFLNLSKSNFEYTSTEYDLRNISLSLSKIADYSWKVENDLDVAANNYNESLLISREILKECGEMPVRLRDVSVCLTKLADFMLEIRNDADLAACYYAESLKICRRVLTKFGETGERLRDLSVSLVKSSDFAWKIKGDSYSAKRYSTEALGVARRVNSEFGETPESLRDISVSLSRVSRLKLLVDGDTNSAAELNAESLQLKRRVISEFGITPSRLSDLSHGLIDVADTAEDGNINKELELNKYTESLQIRRTIIEEFGETPNRLRDISVSLNKLADLALQINGSEDTAVSCYSESLQIDIRLLNEFGETPERLRDVSVSLVSVADALLKTSDDVHPVIKLYDDSLKIRRRLVVEYGETAERLRDVSVCLTKIGDLFLRINGYVDLASRKYKESLEICRDLINKFGETSQRTRDVAVCLHKRSRLALIEKDSDLAKGYSSEALKLIEDDINKHGMTPSRQQDLDLFKQHLKKINA